MVLPFAIAIRDIITVVMPAVEFDDQAFGWAEEIHDVGADRRLASEVRAVHRDFFQSAPQCALVRCRVGWKPFRCCPANRC